MGQGGSISENKSIILSNWTQMKPNSNIYFNKVTNQHIQRHQVLINKKNQLTSYIDRMQDQSLLICRLIYFHPKSTPKDEESKKHNKSNLNTDPHHLKTNARTKSMVSDQMYQQKEQQKNTPPHQINEKQQEATTTKVYSVYTDRMIPVKEWTKEKIVNIIQAFKKLVKSYGLFKVRQHCICENQRKQIKIWINQNPISNFTLQTVESEEDMIADLAALLVSRKQKIAKQLLGIQYFDQVIDHLSQMQHYDYKKFTSLGHNTASNRQNNSNSMPTNRQSQSSLPPQFLPSEVNHFYNVFINTDSNYTVSNSLQSSKYNIINKGNFGANYPYFSEKNHPPPVSRQSDNEDHEGKKRRQNLEKAKLKTQTSLNLKTQNNPSLTPFNTQSLSPTSGLTNKTKLQERAVPKYSSHPNIYHNIPVSEIKQMAKLIHPPVLLIQDYNEHFQEKHMTQNTSIMFHGNKDTVKVVKTKQIYEKSQHQKAQNFQPERQALSIANSQKKTVRNVVPAFSSLNSTQNPTSLGHKLLPSSNFQLPAWTKNHSSGDIASKNQKNEHFLLNDRFNLQKRQINLQLQKQFFSTGDKSGIKQNYLIPQSMHNQEKTSYTVNRQKILQTKKNVQFQEKNHYLHTEKQLIQVVEANRGLLKNQLNPSARSQSKVVGKSSLQNYQKQKSGFSEFNKNVVSQMSTLKPQSYLNSNPSNTNNLIKKSFPKYFQEKQSAKSIQKHYEKSVDQREKSVAVISKSQQKLSPHKNINAYIGGQNLYYQNLKTKDFTQQVVQQVHQSQACSQEIIPPANVNQNPVKFQSEAAEQRRKFPSTVQNKTKKNNNLTTYQENQTRKKPGTQVDSQQSYCASYEGTKSNFLSPNYQSSQHQQPQRPLKKSNNKCFQTNDYKSTMMTNSYFGHINTSSSLLIGHKVTFEGQKEKASSNSKKIFQTDTKKNKNFDSLIDKSEQEKIKWKLVVMESVIDVQKNHYTKNQEDDHQNQVKKLMKELKEPRQSLIQVEQNRCLSFPYKQPNMVERKNEKQFTFYNSSQKPNRVGIIQEIKPYQPKQKTNLCMKKQSIKSNDEQSLPCTTTDQNQRRKFKATKKSQILQTEDLHSSDPGHKIQQIVQRLQKQKYQNQISMIFHEKMDVKQYPKFKKWQPYLNVYGSLINQQQYGSSLKKFKKQDVRSKKQREQNKKSGGFSKMRHGNQDQHVFDKNPPSMVVSQNLETKKNIRKQVLLDYKDLFGQQDSLSNEPSQQEYEKRRKLQIKKRRQQQQRMLQNVSSKDLLIQQKVQKQKQKHAQLKTDLSKLFTQQF